MHITTDALVIKEKNYGESNRLITLLTRKGGVIRAFAAGARNIKSKKGAATGMLSYSNFTLQRKGDTYTVTEAEPIRIFFGAGSDIVCLSLSQYFCELCDVLAPADTDSEEILRLVLNSLHFLTEQKRPPSLIKAITELRLASISGYAPNLVACDGCGMFEDKIMYMRLDTGTIYCENCRTGDYFIPLDITVLKSMRHIVFSPLENLYGFDIPPEAADRLSDITERYLSLQTDHRFATLDFYNSLTSM